MQLRLSIRGGFTTIYGEQGRNTNPLQAANAWWVFFKTPITAIHIFENFRNTYNVVGS
jgi:hypothetical protein